MSLGGKAHDGLRLAEVEPAHLLELVVVTGDIAAEGLHEVVAHGLVDAPVLTREAIVDVTDLPDDAHLEAGLLVDLAEGRLSVSHRRRACQAKTR
jgi:hypothetical protein